MLNTGWNTIDVRSSGWVAVGGASWDSTFTRVLLSVWPTIGNNIQVYMDSIYTNVQLYKAILFSFDDTMFSTYNKVFPLFKSKNIKGTAYIQTELIGYSADYMSSGNLIELDSNGWSIANHCDTPALLTTMTEQQAETALNNAELALTALGLSNSVNNVAYPNGEYNRTTVRNAMINTGMVTGRISVNSGYCMAHPDQNLRLPTINGLGLTYSIESAKTDIDNLEGVGIFYGHGIVDENNATHEWLLNNLEELVSYIKQKNIPIITISDFVNIQNGQIIIRQ